MKQNLEDILTDLCEEDNRYKEDAYEFVLEALSFTQKRFKRHYHVSGPELLEGIKELSMDKFGPLTMMVLEHWGIHSTEDFGNIVFNLVNKRILSKTDEDKLENFKDVFDFEGVFKQGYSKRLARRISRMKG